MPIRPGCRTAFTSVRWALIETSFKFQASCRHTHPAADALLALMKTSRPTTSPASPPACTRARIDVLGHMQQTVHQAKFSMGTVLGAIALYGKAGLTKFR